MIQKELIERIYEAATIQRWNDHVRPFELVELDKQAHKMVIAYVLAKFEETERGACIDWLRLIEGGIFEFLQRVVFTDLKPVVFHKVMAEKGPELNEWMLGQLEAELSGLSFDFLGDFRRYLSDPEYAKLEKRLLRAAHYLATNWEFRMIYHMGPFIYGIDRTKEEIENQIEDHIDLIGVQKISLGKKTFGFIDLCGQLRFQKRWAQTPRVPVTSVLGHMLIVAILSYLCSREIQACNKRLYNNFFSALFHDLPEVLTRDIVSPLKRSVAGLDEVIKGYERSQVDEEILPLLPASWGREMIYFTADEFADKIVRNAETVKGLADDEIGARYNEDRFEPLDGVLIKACDDLAACVEAYLSIKHGIRSHFLVDGRRGLHAKYQGRVIAGIDFGRLFGYFGEE